MFEYHQKSHHSQTAACIFRNNVRFEYHQKSHHSQTLVLPALSMMCLSTIRNHITLKLGRADISFNESLSTIRNHITLKL